MEIAIFGGSGRTGRHLLQQAVEAGHEVKALVRNPAAVRGLPIEAVQGDALDRANVRQVIQGTRAVLSLLGPIHNKPVYEISRCMENIIAAMRDAGVTRLVASVGAGVVDPQDDLKPFHHLMNYLVKRLSRHVYEDMRRVSDQIRASGLDWTIVRVPMLVDGPRTGKVISGFVGRGPGPRLTRPDLAAFMLRELERSEYLHQAPAISSGR